MSSWDPETYLQFSDERSRPSGDLLARVRASAPGSVVDLGCGLGQLSATLAARWPGAQVAGVDSSAAMIDRATREHAGDQVSFVLDDVSHWRPPGPVDVLVGNAALEWVPVTVLPCRRVFVVAQRRR